MMTSRRPKYLQDQDDILDHLKEIPGGATIAQLTKALGRNYGSIQQATVRLRNAERVNTHREASGKIRFYHKP